ncbi:platelet binding protein GspB isoform X4 [Linepithema humile]|uniref:platelet binding protein GspB isoform X4 n=1 Tax=Linepithema humile TaxID=83485 RepID=UPI00351E1900
MFPPVAQGGAGDRPVGDTVARAQQTTGPATTTLWPLAPAQPNQLSNQQFQGIPPLAATPAPAHNQGANRSGTLYSLFSGGGGGSYVAATPATPGQPAAARTYHKVSESVFSAAVGVGMSGYTWGAPTPPPGSYSPVPMTQLDLLKNFANLAPAAAAAAAGQQTLSLQGVGVNVAGSLHHAQHTQHTQHTLNLTGFHHLHHGGLHQNAFSPQLSLVAGSAPTLTINSFSSHNPTGNGVAPTTGVLLQEYQSPIGATAAPAGCTVTVNGSSCLTNTSSTANSMVLHGGSGGGNQATGNQTVQAATVTTKKREAFLSSQGQPVKLENKSTRTSCLCRNSNGKTKVVHSDVGCSRTLPVASSWNGQDGSAGTNNSNAASLTVKREPLASVPCQVAEVSTSLHATTTSVKIEPVPPKSENGIAVPNVGKAVGIAVARQRLQHQETSSMRNVSLSHHTSHHATNYHHFQPDSLGSGTAMTIGGTTLVHCGGPGGEDRAAHLAAIPSGALAPSLNLNSSINSALNSTLGSIGGAPAAATDAAAATWPPTLWQYSATAAAAMPTEPVGFSQMGSGLQGGFQLIRDPTTGQILVIHAAEQMQQAVVFPNYLNHSNNVIPSSLLVPPPPSSIQLLSDIGGARLVLTENKRKQQSASLPIVKIEAECSNSPTAIITSTESSKTALQTMAGALVPDALVTTLYYPQGSALVQISQAEPTAHCRSQIESKTIDAPEKVEVHCQMCPKTPETAIFDEPKPSAVDSTESSRINCESCDKNRNIANGEDRPQIAKKSFDMPNIDCDDQEVQQVVIKQEADDNCYEVCYESSQCEPTSTSERSRSSCERLSQEATKRHSVEKTHHPGIENVVEKLKKSAAALQEATLLPVAQKIDKSTEQLDAEKLRRYSETIPKKLHFLRSCQNSLESNLDTEVSSSQTAEQHDHDQSGHSSQMEDEPSSASSKCDTSGECLINDNNNDSKSNNNNIKVLEDVKLLAMNKKNILYDTYKPKTVWRCEVHPLGKFNATRKSEVVKDDASSETIDNSGLLLLSKSIEQYEQRIGQPEHPQPDAYDAENSSVRSELQISQQSESNNVGNRLRILDLAQIASEIIESDHLEKDGNKRKYPENDDHHVKRYKIDDCKEEETNKDASFNYPEESSANKTMEIIAEQRAAESTKCTVNFSEEKINNVTDERVTDAEEKPLNEDYENYQPKKRNAKLLKDSQVLNKICLDETFDNSQNNDNYDKLSDEGSDSESRIFSGQPTSQVESKKRKASVEDARGDVHDYKNPQTKLETKKFIARKGSRDEGDWPNINAAESNIIAEMANIQKKYKETQLELFKLPPKKDDKKCFGRPRKKSHSSLSSDQGTLPSPPAYEFGSSPNSPVKLSGWIDDAFLPITSAGSIVPTNGTNLEKHISKIERKYQIEHQSHIKLLDSIPSIPTSELPIALPDPIPGPKTAEDSEKNTGTATVNSDVSSSSSAAISISASKRRKVGRPRKFKNLTETIVTKKSKSKSAIVDYVLSPKNRHLQTKQYGYTPLPFKSSMSSLRQSKLQKTKRMKQTPLHKKDVIVSSIFGDKAKKHSSGKVKPKLKAEVMMKNLNDESDTIPPENIPSEESIVQISVEETPAESVEQGMEKEPERPRHEKSKKRKRKLSQSSNSESRESKWHKNCTQCKKTAAESIIKRCKLTDEYLKQDHLRILKESNGLFYAGILSVVQPNEIYAINLDGERGNKSHILPKEDILRDAIVEVRPSSTKEILPGTRLCAYWSHNQRCLYPGISAEPINGNSAEQCEDNYVIVEFDDGDSGRISLEYIRFLLPDYPFVEYNTNPLVSCRKRRRQASASEEKRSVDNDQTAASGDEITAEAFTHERGKTKIEKLCDYHRRKKKIKKDKKLHESQEEKMKHRKHKSSKEHRKERHKHKKHRKHKHRHHDSFGDSSKTSSKESSFEQKSEEEAVHSTSTGFLAAEERTSFETEELSEDNEPQIASEELIESAQEDEEEAQIESEESAEAIEDEEEAQMPEAIQEHDAVQIESKESSDLVEKNDEIPIQESELIQDVQVKSEESPASIGRKLRKQRKTPTNRTSTSRVPTNRPSTNRVSTRRAAKTNLVTSSNLSSTDATTSSSSSSNSPSSNSPSSNSPSSNSSLSSSSSTSSSPSTPPSSNPSLTSPLNSSTPDSSASNPIETTSAIAPMLPNKRLWKWASKPNHTSGGNQYYTAIRRGRETINIGDSVLFYSYKPNEKPYIGKIVQLWSKKSEMKVKCDWFYRPEELHEPCGLNPPGGLFTSDHRDTNDVQTISHKVMVVTLDEYKQMLEKTPQRHQRICEDDTYYYNAGYYKNPKMKLATGVKTIPIQIDNK